MKTTEDKTSRGNLIITKENAKNYQHVTEVSGYVDVLEGATFTAT